MRQKLLPYSKKYLAEFLSWRFWLLPLLVIIILYYPSFFYWYCVEDAGWLFLFSTLCVIAPLAHLICCFKNRAALLSIVGVFTALNMCETGIVVLYHDYILAGHVFSLLNTTTAESGDFIWSNIHVAALWIPLIICYVGVVHLTRTTVTRRRYHTYLAFAWFVLAMGCFAGEKVAEKRGLDVHDVAVLRRPPYNLFLQGYNFFSQLSYEPELFKSKTFTFGAERDSVPEQCEIYVLSVGESLRHASFSLNGTYHRETAPCLAQTPNITYFDNYFSGATMTMYALPQIVSRATADSIVIYYKEKSIVQAFQECGFKTFIVAHTGQFMDYRKDIKRGVDEIFVVTNDSLIAPKIDSLANIYPKIFVMTEFLGNHGYYHNFPAELNRYTPNFDEEDPAESDSLYINAYDNCTLFTDRNLSQMIAAINRPNTLSSLLFVSDHGEYLAHDRGGHGGNMHPVVEEYHVPMLIWNSDSWIAHNEGKYQVLQTHKSSPLSHANLFYTICDMAGVVIPSDTNRQQQQSILSPLWEAQTRYLLLPDGVTVISLDK